MKRMDLTKKGNEWVAKTRSARMRDRLVAVLGRPPGSLAAEAAVVASAQPDSSDSGSNSARVSRPA
jgi:hypothetical protein